MKTKTLNKGVLLVAKPSASDQIFNRTVILVTDYTEFGSVGFILNKPLEKKLENYLHDFNGKFSISTGGPVEQENIYYIHKCPDLIANSCPISNGLFWSGDFNDVRYGVKNGHLRKDNIRFFLGYSGWAKNQLEQEIDNQAWAVKERIDLNIFQSWRNNLWQQEMRNLGGKNLLWIHAPKDLSWN